MDFLSINISGRPILSRDCVGDLRANIEKVVNKYLVDPKITLDEVIGRFAAPEDTRKVVASLPASYDDIFEPGPDFF